MSFSHSYDDPIGVHFSFFLHGLLEHAVMPVQSGPEWKYVGNIKYLINFFITKRKKMNKSSHNSQEKEI